MSGSDSGGSQCVACRNGTDSLRGETFCRRCREWDTGMVDAAVAALDRPWTDPGALEAVLAHPIMALAQSTWAAAPSEGLGAKPAAFDPALVQRIFREEIPLLPRGGSTCSCAERMSVAMV